MTWKSFQMFIKWIMFDWHKSYSSWLQTVLVHFREIRRCFNTIESCGEWWKKRLLLADSVKYEVSAWNRKKHIFIHFDLSAVVKTWYTTTSRQLIHTAWQIHTSQQHTTTLCLFFSLFLQPFTLFRPFYLCFSLSLMHQALSLSICKSVVWSFIVDLAHVLGAYSQWCNNTCEDLLYTKRALVSFNQEASGAYNICWFFLSFSLFCFFVSRKLLCHITSSEALQCMLHSVVQE